MPIYTFVCNKCSTEFEIKIPVIKRDKKVNCIKPNCKSTLKRVMDSPTFRITV